MTKRFQAESLKQIAKEHVKALLHWPIQFGAQIAWLFGSVEHNRHNRESLCAKLRRVAGPLLQAL